MTNPLANDLDHILAHTQGIWDELRGRRIFITGGTGFYGCWLLESFCHANYRLHLDAEAVVLTRDPKRFEQKAPHLANHPCVSFVTGDIGSFEFPPGSFHSVIHAAVSYDKPMDLFTGIIDGTRRTLQFAVQAKAERYHFASSGAVYGVQPPTIEAVPETYSGAPDTMSARSAYGEAKRASEWLCAAFHEEHGLATTISRGFVFVGPYLALSDASAMGSFIRDALNGGPIRIRGDGTPYRSYLYGADLAVWLWTILLRGQACRPYNVGSDVIFAIAEVAEAVRRAMAPEAAIETAKAPDPGKPAERYVPSIDRARTELGLEVTINLEESIRRTAAWRRRSTA